MDQHLAVLDSEELNHGWTRMDTDSAPWISQISG